MNAALWCFLSLGGGRFAHHRVEDIDVTGPGPSTDRFDLYDDLITEDEIVTLTGGPPDPEDKRYRTLHTLATAEYTYQMYSLAYGESVQWAGFHKVTLIPHAEEVEPLSAAVPRYSSSGTIRFPYTAKDPAVYTCLSHDIVVHEVCHALLHASKDWYNANLHTRAVAESLGDILAMLIAGNNVEVREAAIESTAGNFLSKRNVLSKFGDNIGTDTYLRDGTILTSLEESSTWKDAYSLSTAITGALYRAFAYHLVQTASNPPSLDDVLNALLELTRAVFGAINTLPRSRVTVHQLARAVKQHAKPLMREQLIRSFGEGGFNLESQSEDTLLAAIPAGFVKGDGSVSDKALSDLITSLRGEIKLTQVRRITKNLDIQFPQEPRTIVEFTISGDPACLALDSTDKATSIYRSYPQV